MYIYIYTHPYICVYIYIYIHTHTHTHIHTHHAVLPVVIFVVTVISAAATSQVRFSVIVFLVIMGSSKVRFRCTLFDCVRTKFHKSRLGSTGVAMSGARTRTHNSIVISEARFPSFSRHKFRLKRSVRSK